MPRKPIEMTIELKNTPTQELKDSWNNMLVERFLKAMNDKGYDNYTALDLLEKAIGVYG